MNMMTTKYFILAKNKDLPISERENESLYFPNSHLSFILPMVNSDYYIKNGLFEAQLIDWCKQFCSQNSTFLDIGAHTGTYGISLSSHCKTVYCFEPQRMTYYALCGSVALSNSFNIECINKALGSREQMFDIWANETEESAEFYVDKRFVPKEIDVLLNIVSNDGGGSSVQSVENFIARESVKMTTLDSFELKNISFIKIDVENNELNVIKGASETIKNSYPRILFEYNNCYESVNNPVSNYLKTEHNYNTIKITGIANMFLACHEN
jgi:FkbM family methyltransferase